MNKQNQTLRTTFVKAFESYKNKDYKNAEIHCYKILSIDPNHIDSLSMLATLSAINGNFEKAKGFLKQVIKIEPNNLTILQNLGTAHKELGEFDEAIKLYNKVLNINPKHTNSNYNLGLVFYKLNDLEKAKSYLKKTVEIQKNYALAFFSLANVHSDLKEYNDAVSCYQKSIEINPNLPGAHNNLGLIFRILNDLENAISCYKKAIELKSDHAGAYHNLALTLKDLGQFDEAIKYHQKAIKYEPENLAHFHFISELKKDVLDENLKNKIKNILSGEKCTKNNLAYGNFLLAKFERKDKNYEKEFSYLIKGHDSFFKARGKRFELGVKYCFDDVLQISNGAKVNKTNIKKYGDIAPIFIIGVPRCGSTLVEKIIGSGNKTIPIGEETAILENYINKKVLEKQSLNLGNVDEVREELYSIYKEKGLLLTKNDPIFTDKSLNNFFYLELINEIFPKAKIINCKREALSSIVSIFQNNLTELAWTHDLDHIFKYFNNYFEIIENYNSIYPEKIYNLKFEDLLNEPEKVSKKLMTFCNLPWSKRCLEFYKRKDLISKTASNVQIRQAIFKHSPERYLPYKKLLSKFNKNYLWFN